MFKMELAIDKLGAPIASNTDLAILDGNLDMSLSPSVIIDIIVAEAPSRSTAVLPCFRFKAFSSTFGKISGALIP